jgi:putative acetyltransferase
MTSPDRTTIRLGRPGDALAVRQLLDEAFAGPAEGILVERLRERGDLVLAQVAVRDEAVVGYIAWPRLWIETPRDQYKAVALAPLAVAPSFQRIGIGSALTRDGLARLAELRENIVFVLGDPIYYRRFGFALETAQGYESAYSGAHMMALKLTEAAPSEGRLRYPPPFDELE